MTVKLLLSSCQLNNARLNFGWLIKVVLLIVKDHREAAIFDTSSVKTQHFADDFGKAFPTEDRFTVWL
jgi:hypothetical protein